MGGIGQSRRLRMQDEHGSEGKARTRKLTIMPIAASLINTLIFTASLIREMI
jgi:hypothetical protein